MDSYGFFPWIFFKEWTLMVPFLNNSLDIGLLRSRLLGEKPISPTPILTPLKCVPDPAEVGS